MANEQFILLNQKYNTRAHFDQSTQEAGISPTIPIVVNSPDMALGLPKKGLGVTISPMIITNRMDLCD
ncbi:LysR substrate-binding domain-containing protein [Psychrobacillus antarcticus]|uniref:LysR substrate-binding domain-containing protein n=1 Tax=Psychrobacillus antarcticus TaxID=2879115 RepID=UPI00387EB1DA